MDDGTREQLLLLVGEYAVLREGLDVRLQDPATKKSAWPVLLAHIETLDMVLKDLRELMS